MIISFFILFDNVNTSIQTLEEINSLVHGQKSETQYFVTSVDRALWNNNDIYVKTHQPHHTRFEHEMRFFFFFSPVS